MLKDAADEREATMTFPSVDAFLPNSEAPRKTDA